MQDVTNRQFAARVEKLVMAPGASLEEFRRGGPFSSGGSIGDVVEGPGGFTRLQDGGIPVVVDPYMPEGTIAIIAPHGSDRLGDTERRNPERFGSFYIHEVTPHEATPPLYLAPPVEEPFPLRYLGVPITLNLDRNASTSGPVVLHDIGDLPDRPAPPEPAKKLRHIERRH